MTKLHLLFWITLASMLGSLTYILLGLPPESTQGFAQKIFFFHVPAALSMYLSLGGGAVASIAYLILRDDTADLLARACLYTSTFFAGIVIVSGPIWAKPIWGTYWTWDPRLTSTFLIFVLLLGYCFIRRLYEVENRRGALIGASVAILALLDIPLIHFSVRLWRGVHPSVLRNPEGLPENFQMGLELMFLAFFLLTCLLVWILFKHLRLSELKKWMMMEFARRS